MALAEHFRRNGSPNPEQQARWQDTPVVDLDPSKQGYAYGELFSAVVSESGYITPWSQGIEFIGEGGYPPYFHSPPPIETEITKFDTNAALDELEHDELFVSVATHYRELGRQIAPTREVLHTADFREGFEDAASSRGLEPNITLASHVINRAAPRKLRAFRVSQAGPDGQHTDESKAVIIQGGREVIVHPEPHRFRKDKPPFALSWDLADRGGEDVDLGGETPTDFVLGSIARVIGDWVAEDIRSELRLQVYTGPDPQSVRAAGIRLAQSPRSYKS